MFLHQFNNHVVRKGTRLVLKHLGKKWLVVVENAIRTVGAEDDLSAVMESLTMDAPHVYLLILSTTKISFDVPDKASTKTSPSFELSDFGGSHEVVQEITKLCTSVFLQTPTTSKSNVFFLLSLTL